MGGQHVVGQPPALRLHKLLLFLFHQLRLGLLAVVDFLLVIEIDPVLFGEDQGLHEHFGDMGGRVHEAAGAGKDGDQGVVVPGQDGVELVVVAAGAGDAQPQNALGDHVKLLVVDVVDHPDLVLLGNGLGSQGQKPGSDDPAPVGFQAACPGNQVSGDLFQDELVVRKVPVEDIDDVVPVTPGMGVFVVLVVAGGVRVAGHVQPVPAPVLPVPRRVEQPPDHFVEGVGGGVVQETFDVLDGRRQAGQVESGSPQEGQLVGRRRRFQTFLFQLGQNESVDGRPRPVFGGHRRWLGLGHRLQGPEDCRTLGPGSRLVARLG